MNFNLVVFSLIITFINIVTQFFWYPGEGSRGRTGGDKAEDQRNLGTGNNARKRESYTNAMGHG